MKQTFEVTSSGIVAAEAVMNGLRHSYGTRGSWSIVVRDVTSETAEIVEKVRAAEEGLAVVAAERDKEWNARGVAQAELEKMTEERDAALAKRDELRRHLKALGGVSGAVAAML